MDPERMQASGRTLPVAGEASAPRVAETPPAAPVPAAVPAAVNPAAVDPAGTPPWQNDPPLIQALGVEGAKKLYLEFAQVCEALGWNNFRRAGHVQKWYLHLNVAVAGGRLSDAAAFYALQPDQAQEVIGELQLRQEIAAALERIPAAVGLNFMNRVVGNKHRTVLLALEQVSDPERIQVLYGLVMELDAAAASEQAATADRILAEWEQNRERTPSAPPG